ncbi:hypothetical protein [Erwinia psidii]|nr:hypothetical protein [Erwinia psidii]
MKTENRSQAAVNATGRLMRFTGCFCFLHIPTPCGLFIVTGSVKMPTIND